MTVILSMLIVCAMPLIFCVGMVMMVKMLRATRIPGYPAMPVYDASFTVFPVPVHEVALIRPGEFYCVVDTDYCIYRRSSRDY